MIAGIDWRGVGPKKSGPFEPYPITLQQNKSGPFGKFNGVPHPLPCLGPACMLGHVCEIRCTNMHINFIHKLA